MTHDLPPRLKKRRAFGHRERGIRPGDEGFEIFDDGRIARAGLHEIEVGRNEAVEREKFFDLLGFEGGDPADLNAVEHRGEAVPARAALMEEVVEVHERS